MAASAAAIGAQAVQEKHLQDKLIVVGSAIPSTVVPYLRSGAVDFAELWDPKDAGCLMA